MSSSSGTTNFSKLHRLTGIAENILVLRKQEFEKQFPNGQVTKEQFRTMALQIMDEKEVGNFVKNVFKMFDTNKDFRLNFEEFTLATMANAGQGMGDSPAQKLEWLFENIYDKDHSGEISRSELEGILTTLLKMASVPESTSKELVNDIFKEMDANNDGSVSKEEFVQAAKSCELLCQILTSAADRENEKRQRNSSSSSNSSSRRRRSTKRRAGSARRKHV